MHFDHVGKLIYLIFLEQNKHLNSTEDTCTYKWRRVCGGDGKLVLFLIQLCLH